MRCRSLFMIAGSAFLVAAALPAEAMPGLRSAGAAPTADVVLAAGGCGPGYHRGFYGACRPNLYRRFGYRAFGYRHSYRRNF